MGGDTKVLDNHNIKSAQWSGKKPVCTHCVGVNIFIGGLEDCYCARSPKKEDDKTGWLS